jgi:hypothetical protein
MAISAPSYPAFNIQPCQASGCTGILSSESIFIRAIRCFLGNIGRRWRSRAAEGKNAALWLEQPTHSRIANGAAGKIDLASTGFAVVTETLGYDRFARALS